MNVQTTFEEGEDEYSACHDLSGENYMCHYNKGKGFCEELTCDNSPPKQCEIFLLLLLTVLRKNV